MNTEPTAQEEHQAATVGCSQKDRLLARLKETPNVWVPMPELACVMSQGGEGTGVCVSRRIYDLRNAGHEIVQADQNEGHVRKSFYKIVSREGAKDAKAEDFPSLPSPPSRDIPSDSQP